MSDLAPFRSRRSRIALLVGGAVTVVACSSAFKSGHGDTPDPNDDGGVASQTDSSVHVIGPQPGFDAGHGAKDAGEDAEVAIDSAVPCTQGTRSCANGQVVTCLAGGTWGDPVSCGADSPVCSGGMCTAASLDGGATIPPSCAPGGPGMSNCGGEGGVESCCTSLEVPGGTFYRTYNSDPDSGVAMDAGDPATVSGFRLDKYDVTVGRFREFVNAVFPPDGGAGWAPESGAGKHTHLNGGKGLANALTDAGVDFEQGWGIGDRVDILPTNSNLTSVCDVPQAATWSPVGQELLPIVCANWWESMAFCIWDGGFLPSEAELIYAASGGSLQREYPWGSTPPATANDYAIYDCNYPSGSGKSGCPALANIAPVGTAYKGAGYWGQLDLLGNVKEWTLDGYGAFDSPCIDCANLSRTFLILRSVSFNLPSGYFPGRQPDPPTTRGAGVGIRCARTP